MGRKKMLGASAANAGGRPFCYYCDRNFEDETVLVQHQRAKHFRCPECDMDAVRGKCESVQGLIVHTLKVHGKTLSKVPNAQQGRENPELNIYGMDGVPDDILLQKGFQPPPPDDEPPPTKPRTNPPPPAAPPLPSFPGLPGPPLPGMPPLPAMPPPELPGFPGLPSPAMPGFPGLPAPFEMPGFPGLPSPGMPSLTGVPSIPGANGLLPGFPGTMPAFSLPTPSPDLSLASSLPPLLGVSGMPSLPSTMPTATCNTFPAADADTFPSPLLPIAPPQPSAPPLPNGHEAAKALVAPPPGPMDGEDESVEEMRARLERYRVMK